MLDLDNCVKLMIEDTRATGMADRAVPLKECGFATEISSMDASHSGVVPECDAVVSYRIPCRRAG